MQKLHVLKKVTEVLDKHCEHPSADLRKLGEAMIGIADAIEGQTLLEAKATIQSVAILHGIPLA